jgi:predicted membrane-bound spermidine synthase
MLQMLVFSAGAAVMASEMCAARLLAPFFGDSQLVWAVLIGLVMIYLTAGAALGGRWADRSPRPGLLAQIVVWAGFWVGMVPALARPVLGLASAGWAGLRLGLLGGAFIGTLALFGPPVVLLGMVSPFAVRVAIGTIDDAGRTAGRIWALSAAGSIIGTLASVFLLIPALGTRRSLLAIGFALVLLGGLARWAWERRGRRLTAGLLAGLSLAWWLGTGGLIRGSADLAYERESLHNYIRVVQSGPVRHLLLNEGLGIQSMYDPGSVLTGHLFDYFLLAPYFAAQPAARPQPRLALIGLGGGTVARQYTAVYGPVPIDGVEVDPAVIEVARRYFDLQQPNVRAIGQDGRYFLAHTPHRYDVVALDAYRAPYIPFHLATHEFFMLVRSRLTDDGVLAANVGHTGADRALVEALADTVHTVFPSVYLIDAQEDYNTLLVASVQPTELAAVQERLASLDDPHLAPVAARALPYLQPWTRQRPVFTDDRAPVEQVIHRMIARQALAWLRGDEEVAQ